MGSRYLTGLADWLREAGLTVHEDEGWQYRARSSGGFDGDKPWCVMWHHTASDTSAQNDVNYICRGSQDSPIANLYLARNGAVWVCAGGATNTNGKGGPFAVSRGTVPKDSMNTYGISIEAGNDGVGEPWPQDQIDAYFTINNVLAARLGLQPTDLCHHQTWAPDRKIDPARADAVLGPWRPSSINSSGTWDQDDTVDEAQRRSAPPLPGPDPTPPGDDDMAEVVEIQVNGADAVFLGQFMRVGDTTGVLWAEWVNGDDPEQIERLLAYRAMGARVLVLNPDNFGGIGLLGPMPHESRYDWKRSDFGNVIT